MITIKNKKFRGKKAQAAMEFLTTYGWAILILIIVIVALANLGVFRGPRTPNYCTSTAPITCSDVKIVGNVFTLVASATGTFTSGGTPTITAITLAQPTGTGGAAYAVAIPSPATIANTQTTFTPAIAPPGTDPAISGGTRFSGSVTVTYTSEGGTSHTITLPFSGTSE